LPSAPEPKKLAAAARRGNETGGKESVRVYVIVNHSISNPGDFWGALRAAGAPPAGTKVHHMLPSADGSTAVCLWEADGVDTVRRLVDTTVGGSSTNTFFEVDAAHAMGLPK
jgi:hypothetical protein